jgi:MEDS: MEthanogen/methylotroph, DcmR Sensory domain
VADWSIICASSYRPCRKAVCTGSRVKFSFCLGLNASNTSGADDAIFLGWHQPHSRIGFGDHACQLFHNAEDLSQTLIPYFKMGLERNEACVWVTAQPYPAARALSELRQAIPDVDRLLARGQLQIYSYDEWYLKYAKLGMDELVRVWLSRKDDAVAAGYAGLRITGNGSFVTRDAWPTFMDYEKALDAALQDQPIATLCSYWLDTCEPNDVLDVLHCHGCGWAKHKDRWEKIVISADGGRPRSAREEPARAWNTSQEIIQLMEELLRTYAGRTRLEGSPVSLSPPQAANLRLIVTELVANAEKHGALAMPGGTVCVRWLAFINGSRRLKVHWSEAGMSNLWSRKRLGLAPACSLKRPRILKGCSRQAACRVPLNSASKATRAHFPSYEDLSITKTTRHSMGTSSTVVVTRSICRSRCVGFTARRKAIAGVAWAMDKRSVAFPSSSPSCAATSARLRCCARSMWIPGRRWSGSTLRSNMRVFPPAYRRRSNLKTFSPDDKRRRSPSTGLATSTVWPTGVSCIS